MPISVFAVGCMLGIERFAPLYALSVLTVTIGVFVSAHGTQDSSGLSWVRVGVEGLTRAIGSACGGLSGVPPAASTHPNPRGWRCIPCCCGVWRRILRWQS